MFSHLGSGVRLQKHEAAPIDQFQPNQTSPSNKKVLNTLDSFTCIKKSRRPTENSIDQSIRTAITVQKHAKKPKHPVESPVSTDTAEWRQFRVAHRNGDPLIALVAPFKYWRLQFKLVRRAEFQQQRQQNQQTDCSKPTDRLKHTSASIPPTPVTNTRAAASNLQAQH